MNTNTNTHGGNDYTKEEFINAYSREPETFIPVIIERIKNVLCHYETGIRPEVDLPEIVNLYKEEVRYNVEDLELECMHDDEDNDGEEFTEAEILYAIFARIENRKNTTIDHYSSIERPRELTNIEWNSLIERSLNSVEYWNNDIAIFKCADHNERECDKDSGHGKLYVVRAIEDCYHGYLEELCDLSKKDIAEVTKVVLEWDEEDYNMKMASLYYSR